MEEKILSSGTELLPDSHPCTSRYVPQAKLPGKPVCGGRGAGGAETNPASPKSKASTPDIPVSYSVSPAVFT